MIKGRMFLRTAFTKENIAEAYTDCVFKECSFSSECFEDEYDIVFFYCSFIDCNFEDEKTQERISSICSSICTGIFKPDLDHVHGYKHVMDSFEECDFILEVESVGKCYYQDEHYRAEAVKVLAVYDLDHNVPLIAPEYYISDYNRDVTYKLGEITKADRCEYDRNQYCTNGIHFFQSFDAAVQRARE